MLEIFVIYKQPLDYPHSFVLRRHVATQEGEVPDVLPLAVALASDPHALLTVRLAVPRGLVRVQMPGFDSDPCIHEVWV